MRITKCRLSGKAGGEIYFFFFRIARTILRSNAIVLVSNVQVQAIVASNQHKNNFETQKNKTEGMDLKTYQSDCMDLMAEMPDKFVDAIITDPPYFIPAIHYSTRTAFKRNFADLGILDSWFKSLFKEFSRIIKPDGTIYMFCDGQSYPLFYWHCYHFAKSVKPLIWDKQTSINGYEWRHQHELILWANMPDKKQIPTGDGDILKCRAVPVGERQHPAQKPVNLLEALIRKSTNEGDLIFDPFAGSGSCKIAAENTKRNFIGAELNYEYYDDSDIRMAEPRQSQLF